MNRIQQTIAAAHTPEKVWELVLQLADDQNGFTPETYLENIKAYARMATKQKN